MLASSSIDDDRSNNTQKEPTWILVAEEEQPMRNKIGKYLASEGKYTVTGVADAKSALLICRGTVRPKQITDVMNSTKTIPDCLVLGAHLPGALNGLDLVRVIRSDQMLKFIPVVLLTDRGRMEGYDVGADAYLTKPFDLEELHSVIDSLLKRGKRSYTAEGKLYNSELLDNVDALRRELSEIKSLLINSGIDTNDALNCTGNSIHDDIKQIKQIVLNDSNKLQSNEKHHGVDLNQAATIQTQDENTTPMFLHGKPISCYLTSQMGTNLPCQLLTKTLSFFADEVTIMDLIDKGLTNKEVASTTELSIEMVNKKLNSMFKKAAVKNKTELLKWWRNQTATTT